MNGHERVRQCWEKASLYGLLSDSYRYTSPEKSAHYGQLHRDWMGRLAEQVEAAGGVWDEWQPEQTMSGYSHRGFAAGGPPSPDNGPVYPGLQYPGLGPQRQRTSAAGSVGSYTEPAYPGYNSMPAGPPGAAAYYPGGVPYGQGVRPLVEWSGGVAPIRMEPMSSRLRIIHASPGAPPVDIYLNQKLAASSVGYKDVLPYLNVQAGHYLIEVYPAGQTDSPLLARTLNVQAGQSYTLAASDLPEELQLYAYLDDPAPTAGQARLRFIHLSPDSPEVDIRTGAGTTLFGKVGFGQSTAYATAPPGSVDLQVLVSGTEQIVLALSERPLAGDSVTTVVAVGLAGSEPPLEALLVSDL